ncbi:MAG: sigma-70 family RNA polymerase sigma factor [Archangium sp.]|nr:sigma-70 family RNA polymerase sigma factor [Archangium sp.]
MSSALEAAHRSHARSLWALCYRMTGVAADAEELVQDTFVRALEAKPNEDEPLAGYLFRVATRLSIDRLRRRQTEGYKGPWLPSPVPDDALEFQQAPASARYEVLESASFAFLLALEALSPEQRAAVVLGDVFDLSAKEVGACLGLEEANVRQLQHRARKALERYDTERIKCDDETRERTRAAMEGFFFSLATGDVEGAKKWLADDVQVLSDGAGVFHAAMVPIHGPDRTTLFFSRLMQLREVLTSDVKRVNGTWAVDATFALKLEKDPPRGVTCVQLDAAGKIAVIYSIVAPAKLTAPTP